MPKIPIVRPNQGMNHIDTYTPNQAPGLDYGINTGWGDAARQLAGGVAALAGGIDHLFEIKQAADDEDNLSEIQFLTKKKYALLEERMKENANDYSSFSEWQATAQEELDNEVQPYLEKLSDEGRKKADLFLKEKNFDGKLYTKNIAFQADITTKRNRYDFRIKEYAKVGDTEAAQKQLNAAIDTGIFKADEREQYQYWIDQCVEMGEVERLIEENPVEAEKLLKDKEKFTKISVENKKRFRAMAEQKSAQNEIAADDLFARDILDGNCWTEDQILAEEKSGAITLAQANRFRKIARDYWTAQTAERQNKVSLDLVTRSVDGGSITQKEVEELYHAGDLSLEQRNKWIGFLKDSDIKKRNDEITAKQKEAEFKAKVEEKKYKFDLAQFKFKMLDFKFSQDSVQAVQEYNYFNKMIHDVYLPTNPADAIELKKQLDSSYKAVTQPEDQSNYKTSFLYNYGMKYLEQNKNAFYAQEPGWGDWLWGTYDTDDTEENSDILNANYAQMKILVDDYIKKNPNATTEEVKNFINYTKEEVNQTMVDDLMGFWSRNTGFNDGGYDTEFFYGGVSNNESK